ncbi:hypothetical protein C4544_04085 [candidate division WS5 bacterium]|uniref:ABC-type transport auxiliary lipoprotein component domain-containing protein n=1 Tax=candidate division WS5 bacterium TaxID=2093353 RepID=A0A419DCR6_9BACT|nr:MAG: hypothetical protein C4544_04085 [candidate division WS5 bacterium]
MRNIFLAICCTMLLGCSMAPLGQNVIRQNPIETANKSKPISVMKLVDTIEQGRIIGKAYGGLACIPNGDLLWRGNEKMINNIGNIARIKLGKYGYSLVGKEYSPFNEEYSKQSELLLGGKLIDVKSNACLSISGIKGEVYIKVEWEIYNTKEKNIILAVNTEGYSSSNDFNKIGDKDLYEQAFDMAIDNLLAEKLFYALLTKEK